MVPRFPLPRFPLLRFQSPPPRIWSINLLTFLISRKSTQNIFDLFNKRQTNKQMWVKTYPRQNCDESTSSAKSGCKTTSLKHHIEYLINRVLDKSLNAWSGCMTQVQFRRRSHIPESGTSEARVAKFCTQIEYVKCYSLANIIGATTLWDPWDASPQLLRMWGPRLFGPPNFYNWLFFVALGL